MLAPAKSLLARMLGKRASPPPVTRSLDAAVGGRRWRDDRRALDMGSVAHNGAAIVAARAAHFTMNTPEGAKTLETLAGNLVGTGITPRPQHPVETIRDRLASSFLSWTDTADADGNHDFYGMQAMLVRDMATFGEAVATILPDRRTGAPTIRRLHPEQLERAKSLLLPSGARIVQGIEFDADGRRVAYWLRPSAPGEPLAGTPFVLSRLPASNVIHMFRQLVPGQVRGLSWFAPVLLPAKDLDALLDAMLVRAKVAAMFVGSLHDPDGTAGGFEGDQKGGDLDTTAEPGTIRVEQNGSRLDWSDPPDSGDTVAFSKAMHRRLAAGTGVTYEMLTGDYSETNYSSARAALLEFRRFAEGIQHHVIVHQLCRPVWNEFVRWQVLAGGISATAYQRDRAVLQSAKWLPPAWPWVDPMKDAQAAVLEMDNLIRSRAEIVAERGYDIEALDREIAAERARAERLKLSPKPKAKPAVPESEADNAAA